MNFKTVKIATKSVNIGIALPGLFIKTKGWFGKSIKTQ
jgi:hypothetical protein